MATEMIKIELDKIDDGQPGFLEGNEDITGQTLWTRSVSENRLNTNEIDMTSARTKMILTAGESRSVRRQASALGRSRDLDGEE
jgi:hypothetical protein